MATLFAKLEEQAARQEQFYREQDGKLEQQYMRSRNSKGTSVAQFMNSGYHPRSHRVYDIK